MAADRFQIPTIRNYCHVLGKRKTFTIICVIKVGAFFANNIKLIPPLACHQEIPIKLHRSQEIEINLVRHVDRSISYFGLIFNKWDISQFQDHPGPQWGSRAE